MPTFNKVVLRGYFDTALTLKEELNAKITLKTPPGVIIDTDDGRVRLPETQTFTAAQLKAGMVEIAATDDVNANPAEWFYYLTEDWEGGRRDQPIVIPSSAPTDPDSGKPTWDYWKLASASTTNNVVVPTIVRRVNGVAPDAAGDIVIPIPTGGGSGGGGGGDVTVDGYAVTGDVHGSLPNLTFTTDMATQAELDAVYRSVGHFRGLYAQGTAYITNDVFIYRKFLPGSTTDKEPGGRTYRVLTGFTAAATLDFSKVEELGQQTALSDYRYFPADWAPNVNYAAGQPAVRVSDGALIRRIAAGISPATFAADSTNWKPIGGTSTGSTSTATAVTETPTPLTSAYSVALTDAGKLLEVTASAATTVTLPAHSLVPLPVGSSVRVRQMGTGQVIFSAGPGVTLQSPGSNRTRTQLSTVRLYKRDFYTWVLEEDVAEEATPPRVPSSTVAVTFPTTDHTIDPLKMFSLAVSGYTGTTGDIRYNTAFQQSAKNLGAGLLRFAFKWNSTANKPYAGSKGGINDPAGADAWVAGMVAGGTTGMKIIGLLEGEEDEMAVTPDDATKIVNYANAHNWPVEAWVVGNEPEILVTNPADPSGPKISKKDYLGRDTKSGVTYADLFCRIGSAVKAADPTAKLWGPSASAYSGKVRTTISQAIVPGADNQFFNDFWTGSGAGTTVAALLDGMSWHTYMSGNGGVDVSTSALMARTLDAYGQVVSCAATLAQYPAYASKMSTMTYSINEWNIFYQPGNGRQGVKDEAGNWYDERPQTAEGTVFVASVLKNMCRTAAKAYFMFFGDLVGPLGMWTRNTWDATATPPLLGDNMGTGGSLHYPHGKPALTPYATYWGMAMYTGAAFGVRRVPAIVPVMPSHGIANLEVAAFTDGVNAQDIILINKDETTFRRLNVRTTGITSGTVDLWQTDRHAPWDPPRKIASTQIIQTQIAQSTPMVVPAEGTIFDVVLPPMTVTRAVINS